MLHVLIAKSLFSTNDFCFYLGLLNYINTEVSTSKAKMFPLVTFVDTPGLVDGDMNYPFDVNQAILWLGDLVDLIFVFFDPIGQVRDVASCSCQELLTRVSQPCPLCSSCPFCVTSFVLGHHLYRHFAKGLSTLSKSWTRSTVKECVSTCPRPMRRATNPIGNVLWCRLFRSCASGRGSTAPVSTCPPYSSLIPTRYVRNNHDDDDVRENRPFPLFGRLTMRGPLEKPRWRWGFYVLRFSHKL